MIGLNVRPGMIRKRASGGGGGGGSPWATINTVKHAGAGATSAIDTTGANLIVAVVSQYDGSAPSITDNKGNVYSLAINSTGIAPLGVLYCANPVVGAGHTFTNIRSASSICVAAFSGANVAPLGAANFASGSSASPITPSQDITLLIAGAVYGSSFWPVSEPSVSDGFSIVQAQAGAPGSWVGCAMAKLIQETAASVDPTWSGPSPGAEVSGLVEFKPDTGEWAVIRANSPSMLLADTGSDEGVWDDLSGNGIRVTQPTEAIQPTILTGELNGRQVRSFTRNNGDGFPNTNLTRTVDYLDILGATSGHIFIVSNAYLIGANHPLEMGSYFGPYWVLAGHNGNRSTFLHSYTPYTGTAQIEGPIDYQLPWYIHEFWRDGSDMEVLRNGVSIATTSSATGSMGSGSTSLIIGSNGGYAGKVALLATFKNKLNSTAAAAIRAEINAAFFP